MTFSVKLYPNTIWGDQYRGDYQRIIADIRRAGISSVIVPAFQGSRVFFLTEQDEAPSPWDLRIFRDACAEQGLAFIPEFPMFHDPDTFDSIPQYRPVDIRGNASAAQEWYKPICPSNEPYRNYRTDLIYKAMRALEPAMISLDFLHFPYFPGSEQYRQDPASLPDFCYCDFCLYQFRDFSGVPNPQDDVERWYLWRSETITLIPILIAEYAEKHGMNLKIMAQTPAAPSQEYLEYVRRITGQDLRQWREIVHVISPNLHLNRFNVGPSWGLEIMENIKRNQGQDFALMPEIDLPLVFDASEQDDRSGVLLESLKNSGTAAVSLFSWDLLRNNQTLLDRITALAD